MNKTLLAVRLNSFATSPVVRSACECSDPSQRLHNLMFLVRCHIRGIQTLAEVIDNFALVQLCDEIAGLDDLELDSFIKTSTIPG